MTLRLRQAGLNDLPWINARYCEVDFVSSDESDVVAIAEVDQTPAGLGRIVPVADGTGELGGMYVFNEFRGQGVATAIIDFLISQTSLKRLYCLPFAELEDLYRSLGFERVPATEQVPAKVADKHRWCNAHYGREVLLMKLTALPRQES